MDDLKGLKFRSAASPADPHAPRCRAAADRGRRHLSGAREGHDRRCEWVGPYDDEKLGFNKVAKFYYYPGWWEGAPVARTTSSTILGEATQPYKAMVEAAAGRVTFWMVPKYDAGNPAALRRLVAAGTELRPFPRAVLEPCFLEPSSTTTSYRPRIRSSRRSTTT